MSKKKAKKKSVPTPRPDQAQTRPPLGAKSQQPSANSQAPTANLRTYTILDYRLEKPDFTLRQIVERKQDGTGDEFRY
jgi:hypothetical protein